MAIEFFACFFFEFLYDFSGVSVEQVDEGFEYVQVESGGYEFSVRPPFLTGGDEETISQPRFEESVLASFVDVHVTTQNDFYIPWVDQEDK